MERMEYTLRHFLGVESAEPDLQGKLAFIVDICEVGGPPDLPKKKSGRYMPLVVRRK